MSNPVWICMGLGTDSIAMTVEMVRRGERIDLITFADTGGELPHTYALLPVMNEFLVKHGYDPIVVVRYSTRAGKTETLEESITRNETLPALAFGFHTCSIRFKIEPQVRYAKTVKAFQEAWERGQKVIRCIGYDASPADTKRANRPTTNFPDFEEFENRLPLREWGWTRERCREEILKEGLPDPGKSSCYFCPARKKTEIIELAKTDPEYMERALAIEQRAIDGGKLKKTIGLGRHWTWASLLKEVKDVG